jgi:hypothetical protein
MSSTLKIIFEFLFLLFFSFSIFYLASIPLKITLSRLFGSLPPGGRWKANGSPFKVLSHHTGDDGRFNTLLIRFLAREQTKKGKFARIIPHLFYFVKFLNHFFFDFLKKFDNLERLKNCFKIFK